MHRTPRALQTPLTTGIKTVTSIAVRCPTITAAGESLPSGHCYLMLPPAVTLRNLIAEKVRAELRKVRAAGPQQSTIDRLCGAGWARWRDDLLVDTILYNDAIAKFFAGDFSVSVNGHEIEDLATTILLNRETSIAFIVAAPVLA